MAWKATVVVSVVHIVRGILPGPYLLDENPVPIITAYLFPFGLTRESGSTCQQ